MVCKLYLKIKILKQLGKQRRKVHLLDSILGIMQSSLGCCMLLLLLWCGRSGGFPMRAEGQAVIWVF